MRAILVVVCLLFFSVLHAQKASPSITLVDTTFNKIQEKEIKIKEDFIPIPKKALLYSLILPGAGQVYNRKYWKLPLVFGAYGGLIYAFDFNGSQHKKFKEVYEYRITGQDELADEIISSAVSDAALKSARDSARKNLELTYMAAIVVHALNGIEAFVDAHLRNFDISEDLSLSIRPTFESSSLGVQSGIGVFVTF